MIVSSIPATPRATAARATAVAPADTQVDLFSGQPQTEEEISPSKAPETARSQAERAGVAWVQDLLTLAPDSPEFRKQVDGFMRLGRKESEDLVRSSAVLMQQNVTGGQAGSEGQMRVSKSLQELRQQIQRIDPTHAYARFHNTPILKYFVSQEVKPEYLNDFQDAQGHIGKIAMDLHRGQDSLRRDNITLDQQQKVTQGLTQGLDNATATASSADAELARQIDRLRLTDPEKADALLSQAHFPVRQKLQDLTTQSAVNTQANLVFGLIRNNNVELVRQVERAAQITLAALQVGVTASIALNHQKGVMTQAQEMTQAAEEVVTSTAANVRAQSEAMRPAPAVNPEALKQKLVDVYASLDEADVAKARSVEAMEKALKVINSRK